MKTFVTTLLALLCCSEVSLAPTPALAQSEFPRAFVSSRGDDSGTCTLAVPVGHPSGLFACRLLARALEVVSDGGSVICVDPGQYGIANVTKSVTIDCKNGGNGWNVAGVAINAPGKNVRLRNMTINGGGFVSYGVVINAAGSVELDNVVVTGVSDTAVYDRRAGPGKLSIRNSIILGPVLDSSVVLGVLITPQSGTINAVLDNVAVRNAMYGIAVASGSRVMINRSVFSHNRSAGIEADGGAIMEVNDTLVSNNTTGILGGGGTIAISNSSISSNNTGVRGATISYGNNRFTSNISDGQPPTPVGATSSESGLR